MKYLISDLDHTLLNEAGQLSAVTRQVIRQQPAWQVMLASARLPAQMVSLIDALDLTGPQVGLNGAIVFEVNGGQVRTLTTTPLAVPVAQELFDLVHTQWGLPIQWLTASTFFATELTPQVQLEIDYTGVTVTYAPKLPAVPVLAFLLILPDRRTFNRIQAQLAARWPDLTLADSGDGYLMITAPGVDKSQAARYLLAQGVAQADLYGVGDDLNDLPLLKAVDHPLAVANAQPAVRACAGQILASNQADGVAHFLAQS